MFHLLSNYYLGKESHVQIVNMFIFTVGNNDSLTSFKYTDEIIERKHTK